MIEAWKQSPSLTLQSFYETCTIPSESRPSGLPSWESLERDLHSLSTPGNFRHPLSIPHRVIGSRDDAVVPSSLLESEWENDKILWSERGGHALGFFESDFVAESIHTLIREVLESRRS
jgi:hypothetical protein